VAHAAMGEGGRREVSDIPTDADLMAAATEAERAAPVPARPWGPALTAMLRYPAGMDEHEKRTALEAFASDGRLDRRDDLALREETLTEAEREDLGRLNKELDGLLPDVTSFTPELQALLDRAEEVLSR